MLADLPLPEPELKSEGLDPLSLAPSKAVVAKPFNSELTIF